MHTSVAGHESESVEACFSSVLHRSGLKQYPKLNIMDL